MNCIIKHEGNCYVMYVNGKFFGSYDTVEEAAKDVDTLVMGREKAVRPA